ncbi:TPA: transporter substrate-binding domain-containing protein [Streptococcus pneumoniae]
MKKLSLLLAILPFLVACGNQATPKETSAQKTIVLATAGDVPPFDYEDKGNLTGFDIEVLKAVDEKLSDYEIQFQRTAWESIFPGLDSGHYQAAANNLSYTKERAEKYLYSLPISNNPLVLVSNKKNPLTSLDQIAGKTTQEDIGKRILDLANGEFDFLVFDKVSVQKIIKDRGLDLSVVDLPSADSPSNYIIFSSDQKEFKEQFDKALKELYQDGTLEKLSNTYLGGSYLPDQSQLQ